MESERPGSAGPILTLAVALIVIVAGVGSGLYQAMHDTAPASATRAHSQTIDVFSLMRRSSRAFLRLGAGAH